MLFKKEIFETFGNFREEFFAAEDRLFLSMLSINGIKFQYILFIGGWRRQHNNNMTKKRLLIHRNMIHYYKTLNNINEVYEYVQKHFCYSGHEMMNANMSYMYYLDIINGTSSLQLHEIRNLFKKENLQFFPIPIPAVRSRGSRFFLKAYIIRWLRKITTLAK